MFIKSRSYLIAAVALFSVSVTPLSTANSQNDNRASRTVLLSFGTEKLNDYRFNPKPICPVPSKSPSCVEHPGRERQAVDEIMRNSTPKPEREFRMSPVRDSGEVALVHLYLIIDPIEPGYGAIEEYQFVLDKSRTKVLRQQRLTNDLFVSNKK